MGSSVCLVIATKNRPENVKRTLAVIDGLGVLGEITTYIADSSTDSATKELCAAFPRVTWLDTRGKGKTESLNVALQATRSKFVAFLDDDAVPYENRWLDPLLAHFADPLVGYVSGRVLAEEQRTEAQRSWQQKGALDKGGRPLRLDQEFFNRYQLKGLQVQLATMGANHVVRRSVFETIGLHDERFGPGQNIPGAGADLDLTYRVLRAGYAVVYEPCSAVYHRHPESFSELKARLYEYGIGDTAVHCKFLFEFGDWRSFLQLFYRPSQNLVRALGNLFGKYPLPASCSLYSIVGNFAGPVFYLRHRRRRAMMK